MKPIKQLMIFVGILIMCLGFAACSAREEASNDLTVKDGQQSQIPGSQTPESQPPETQPSETQTPSEEATIVPMGSDPMSLPPYSYEVEDKNWNVDGITARYPMIVNSNMQDKADKANNLIKNDLSEVIETIKNNVDDKTLTIDGVFTYAKISPTVLSVIYYIDYNASSLAYPVDLCHTITLSLDQVAIIPLSDLFVIDEAFVEGFKSWMYAPYRDDLNLETSGINIKEEIENQYYNDELIKLFSAVDAPFYLADQGLILSIGVPHALGDHLEMAISYEFLEAYMKKDHPLWKDYMFLGGDIPDGTTDSIDVNIKVGEIFTATLDENSSTGYGWQYEIGDETVVSFDSDRVLEDGSANNDEPAIVGAGSQHEWKFKGLKQGSTTITFTYSRSWETASKGAKTILYNITVE